MCGNKNPNKLKRSIVVGQEIIQAGAELVEKEGGEGKKRNIFLSLCRDVNSQTGYISSYTENISFLVGRNENKSFIGSDITGLRNMRILQFLVSSGALETPILFHLFV